WRHLPLAAVPYARRLLDSSGVHFLPALAAPVRNSTLHAQFARWWQRRCARSDTGVHFCRRRRAMTWKTACAAALVGAFVTGTASAQTTTPGVPGTPAFPGTTQP